MKEPAYLYIGVISPLHSKCPVSRLSVHWLATCGVKKWNYLNSNTILLP